VILKVLRLQRMELHFHVFIFHLLSNSSPFCQTMSSQIGMKEPQESTEMMSQSLVSLSSAVLMASTAVVTSDKSLSSATSAIFTNVSATATSMSSNCLQHRTECYLQNQVLSSLTSHLQLTPCRQRYLQQ
jgi:hypothetical protein